MDLVCILVYLFLSGCHGQVVLYCLLRVTTYSSNLLQNDCKHIHWTRSYYITVTDKQDTTNKCPLQLTAAPSREGSCRVMTVDSPAARQRGSPERHALACLLVCARFPKRLLIFQFQYCGSQDHGVLVGAVGIDRSSRVI